MDTDVLIHLLPIIAYLGATAVLVVAELRNRPDLRLTGLLLAALAVIGHAVALYAAIDHVAGRDVNFLNMLSLSALLIMAVLLLTAAASRRIEACTIALPGAALCLGLQWLVPIEPLMLGSLSPAARLHIVSSLLAYSLLSIAAINALMLATQDYTLRHPRLIHRLEFLPPLTVIETMMFRLILVGWLLLSLSLASGLVFIEDLFAQHLLHKTVLSILSWLLFGLLLLGRWRLGWRGRRAVRWALAAMLVLALGYFGSKLVLEVLLDRNWQLPAG